MQGGVEPSTEAAAAAAASTAEAKAAGADVDPAAAAVQVSPEIEKKVFFVWTPIYLLSPAGPGRAGPQGCGVQPDADGGERDQRHEQAGAQRSHQEQGRVARHRQQEPELQTNIRKD